MIFMMMMMVLLARIWESKVREEKNENADEKDETKQTARNQLRFRFHLWVSIFMYDGGDGEVDDQVGQVQCHRITLKPSKLLACAFICGLLRLLRIVT